MSPLSNHESNPLDLLSRYGQFILITIIVTVLSLMLFPLPPLLLDFLLALNIVGSITILMVTLSITDSMKLSSFPTLILICALFRLGLNISSTRLILAQGEAGDIIQTFGHFVTGGNLIVGVVVFLILLIIQFLVVAKGSERVAEVAARFTLDALPGKQMSIDADLRAGMITSEDAARLRSQLLSESRFYGSMDGAMKFVKGDTIAGFVITFINIVGGLAVGVLQRGLDLSVATEHYTILTVGDGLVSQIPALVISLSAGLIVTRVSGLEGRNSLGGDIGRQIFAEPKVFFTVALVSILMAFIPGFPTALFLLLAGMIFLFATSLIWRTKKIEKKTTSIGHYLIDRAGTQANLGHAEPLLLELGLDLYRSFLVDSRWQSCFNEMYPKLRLHLSRRMGVPFPELKLMINEDLSPDTYRIKIFEIPVGEGFLSLHHSMIDKAPEEIFLRYLAKILKKRAADFIGIQELRDILSNVEKYHPELVRETVPRMLSIQKLTDIIKRLVEEGIPVNDFRLILETLSTAQPDSKDAVDLCELARMGLKRLISYQYAGSANKLSCFVLDTEIESEISKNIKKSDGECYLNLAPERIKAIIQAIKTAYKNHQVSERELVILTHVEIRRYVRKILESECPDIAVLSFQELDTKINIDTRDTISFYDAGLVEI